MAKQSKPKNTGLSIRQIELSLTIVLGLVMMLSFFNNAGITGFVSVNSYSQGLNMTLYQNTALKLSTNDNLLLDSFKLTGKVQGGSAQVYLDNGQGQRLLIYDNLQKVKRPPSLITGMVIGTDDTPTPQKSYKFHIETLPQFTETTPLYDQINLIPLEGPFENICKQTCFIKMQLNPESSYKLIIFLSEQAQLKIDSISFTLIEE